VEALLSVRTLALDGRLVVAVQAVPPPVGVELPDLPMSVLPNADRVGKGVPSAGGPRAKMCGAA